MTTIAVCALTLQRPQGITRLLTGIAAAEMPDGVTVRVVVVDNDPEQSARPIIEGLAADFPLPLQYVHEPRRGIPFGRNAAVHASGDADFIAFLDDDEYPDPKWLVELVRVQRDHHADVVEGPVLPDYEPGIPQWIIDGGFFERPRTPTGTLQSAATTSNVLFARRVYDLGPFAEWMGLTGGDDTHFFRRARLAGCRIVSADDAVVHEVIPATRASTRWLLRRQFRRGTTWSQCLRDLEDSRRHRVTRVGRAGVDALQGLARCATGLVRGRVAVVQGAQQVWYAAGLVAGLWNVQYREYEVVHGS